MSKVNSFRFLDVDVTESVSELQLRGSKKIKFLEWAKVLILLQKHGVEHVSFGVIDHSIDEYPAFYDSNGNNPFVKVWVKIDDDKFEITYPVIANQGTTFKVVERPSQLDMEFSKARAFVKCVAINTGLGLKLWLTETQELAKIEDESSMDNKQLNEELDETMVKLALAFKDREKAYALIGTTKDIYNNFCNRDDLIAFEQKLGWYKTLKVAIHDLNSQEKTVLEDAEKGVNGEVQNQETPSGSENTQGLKPSISIELATAFERFKEEYSLSKYEDLSDLLENKRKTADDMKFFAKQLGITYTSKPKTREAILKLW